VGERTANRRLARLHKAGWVVGSSDRRRWSLPVDARRMLVPDGVSLDAAGATSSANAEAKTAGDGEADTRLLDLLRAAPADGLGTRRLAELSGLGTSTARRRLVALEARGQVARLGRRKGWTLAGMPANPEPATPAAPPTLEQRRREAAGEVALVLIRLGLGVADDGMIRAFAQTAPEVAAVWDRDDAGLLRAVREAYPRLVLLRRAGSNAPEAGGRLPPAHLIREQLDILAAGEGASGGMFEGQLMELKAEADRKLLAVLGMTSSGGLEVTVLARQAGLAPNWAIYRLEALQADGRVELTRDRRWRLTPPPQPAAVQRLLPGLESPPTDGPGVAVP
jgi:hypothetical protein